MVVSLSTVLMCVICHGQHDEMRAAALKQVFALLECYAASIGSQLLPVDTV
jgi:hypothetical protein